MKKLSALLLIFAMLFSFAACKEESNPNEVIINDPTVAQTPDRESKIKIAVGNDPMGLGFAKLSIDRAYAYDVEFGKKEDALIADFKAGKTDIISVSLDTAARLYNEGNGDIQMLAINTLGMIYVLSTDEELTTIDGLKGKTIYCPSDNEGVKAIFAKTLSQSGVSDVDVQYKANDEIMQDMIDGKINLCVLPEFKALGVIGRTENVLSSITLAEVWKEKLGFELAQGCIIAKKDYISNNSEAVKELLAFYEPSINYLNKNVTGASLFLFENEFIETAEAANALIPRCNLSYVEGEEMKALAQKNYGALAETDSKILSGSIPADDFYYGV